MGSSKMWLAKRLVQSLCSGVVVAPSSRRICSASALASFLVGVAEVALVAPDGVVVLAVVDSPHAAAAAVCNTCASTSGAGSAALGSPRRATGSHSIGSATAPLPSAVSSRLRSQSLRR
jgi:hypothetical protein